MEEATMIYAIYEEFYADVEKKLNRIAKKCKKHGNDFTFEIKGEEIREKFNTELNRTECYKFILVNVDGTAKIDNWECIAVLENHEVGNIIRRINTEINIPQRFKHTENFCEHCNSKRQRNNLYVIHNTETDEWKQVGGSCLKLYTGGLNMEYVTAYMDGITELEEFDGIVGHGKAYYHINEILSYAVEVIEKAGYFNAQSNIPTKYIVSTLMHNTLEKSIEIINKDFANARIDMRFDYNDFHKKGTAITIEKIISHYKNVEDSGEFIHNVKVMLNEEYVLAKNFGFLCYLPQGYANHIQREIKKAERIKTEYFGEVGKRYKDKVIQNITLITSWESQWGYTYVYKIILEDNSVLTWKTSNGIYLDRNEEFDKISFTVKEHKEYKGEKQTEITRCNVTKKIVGE
jgi:hypothetical protein